MEEVLKKLNKDKLEKNYNLSKDLTHKFKKPPGDVLFFYRLDLRSQNIDNDLDIISELFFRNEPFVVFGECTNLYITEKGYNGLFISIQEYHINGITFDTTTNTFNVKADCNLTDFVKDAAALGYDFSDFYQIPGLVGSAVCGNSGSDGVEIGEFVRSIRVYDIKEKKYDTFSVVPNSDFFTLRNSKINEDNKEKTRYIIVECELQSEYIGKDNCELRIRKKKADRTDTDKTSELEGGTAGSFWTASALPKEYLDNGKKVRDLISDLGLNRLEINGAKYVTKKNFLTTSKHTKDRDVAHLLDLTTERIKARYNFYPKNEVVILDYDGRIDAAEFIRRYKRHKRV